MQYILTTTTRKAFAVDDRDYFRLSMFKWYETGSGNGIHRYKSRGHLTNGSTVSIANEIFGTEKILYDHKDRNYLNNTKDNFRIATRSQNQANRKRNPGTSSKYRGVSFHKPYRKWQANIVKNSKSYFLGYFLCEIEAALAYNSKAKELHGEFAVLNKI